jgi:hypothetical protein
LILDLHHPELISFAAKEDRGSDTQQMFLRRYSCSAQDVDETAV